MMIIQYSFICIHVYTSFTNILHISIFYIILYNYYNLLYKVQIVSNIIFYKTYILNEILFINYENNHIIRLLYNNFISAKSL